MALSRRLLLVLVQYLPVPEQDFLTRKGSWQSPLDLEWFADRFEKPVFHFGAYGHLAEKTLHHGTPKTVCLESRIRRVLRVRTPIHGWVV